MPADTTSMAQESETQPMTLVLREQLPADAAAVTRVNDLAFGQPGESQLVAKLVDGGWSRLSLVAENDGQIVGHILFSTLPIVAADGVIPSLALAPMSVLPEFQSQGIGSKLVTRGLELCREREHQIVIVLGHIHFYPRFGFSAALAKPLDSPYAGESFMAVELTPGALNGIQGRVEYPPPFNEL